MGAGGMIEACAEAGAELQLDIRGALPSLRRSRVTAWASRRKCVYMNLGE